MCFDLSKCHLHLKASTNTAHHLAKGWTLWTGTLWRYESWGHKPLIGPRWKDILWRWMYASNLKTPGRKYNFRFYAVSVLEQPASKNKPIRQNHSENHDDNMCCNCVMHLEGHRWYGWYMESKHWPTSTNTFDASWHITVTSPTRLLVLLPHLLNGKIVLSTFFHQSGFQTWHEDI